MHCPKCDNERIEIAAYKEENIFFAFLLKLLRILIVFFTCGLWLLVPKKNAPQRKKSIGWCSDCHYKFKIVEENLE